MVITSHRAFAVSSMENQPLCCPEFWRSKTRTTLVAPIADWQLGYKVYATFHFAESLTQRMCGGTCACCKSLTRTF